MRLLRETPPLVGTLGRSEAEYAAALILYGLHSLRRAWTDHIYEAELIGVLRRDAALEPIKSWRRNPFLQPDFDDLIARGFAKENGAGIELTPSLLERVAAHLVIEPAATLSRDDGEEHW